MAFPFCLFFFFCYFEKKKGSDFVLNMSVLSETSKQCVIMAPVYFQPSPSTSSLSSTHSASPNVTSSAPSSARGQCPGVGYTEGAHRISSPRDLWLGSPEPWLAVPAHKPCPPDWSSSTPWWPFLSFLPSFPFVVWQTQTFQRKLLPVPERETMQCHLPNTRGAFSGSPCGTETLRKQAHAWTRLPVSAEKCRPCQRQPAGLC